MLTCDNLWWMLTWIFEASLKSMLSFVSGLIGIFVAGSGLGSGSGARASLNYQ